MWRGVSERTSRLAVSDLHLGRVLVLPSQAVLKVGLDVSDHSRVRAIQLPVHGQVILDDPGGQIILFPDDEGVLIGGDGWAADTRGFGHGEAGLVVTGIGITGVMPVVVRMDMGVPGTRPVLMLVLMFVGGLVSSHRGLSWMVYLSVVGG
jgi:hypothetical protein